jgi:hypothetical protein
LIDSIMFVGVIFALARQAKDDRDLACAMADAL